MVKTLAAAAVALALATTAFFLLRGCGDPDARQIRRTLRQAAETAELNARENQLAAAANARRIGRFVTEDVIIIFGRTPIPPAGIQTRDALVLAAIQARTLLSRFTIEPQDVELEIEPDRQSATMTLSLRVSADGPAGPETIWKNARVEWVHQDGQWLISRAQAMEPIEQPR